MRQTDELLIEYDEKCPGRSLANLKCHLPHGNLRSAHFNPKNKKRKVHASSRLQPMTFPYKINIKKIEKEKKKGCLESLCVTSPINPQHIRFLVLQRRQQEKKIFNYFVIFCMLIHLSVYTI